MTRRSAERADCAEERGTAGAVAAVGDGIAEFTPGRRLSLLDMVAIENRLADNLGVGVELAPARRGQGAGCRQGLP